MYSLFDLIDAAVQEKTNPEQPKETVYQEYSETTFHPDLADWQALHYMPETKECEVIGLIPKDLFGPTEKGNYRSFTPEWNEQQEIWGSYVHALCEPITKQNVSTYWLDASKKLVNARDEQTPVRLRITDFSPERFVDLEVIEYLSATEGSGSND